MAVKTNENEPHKYTKSYGDGSPRNHCRCGRNRSDPIHSDDTKPEYNGELILPERW